MRGLDLSQMPFGVPRLIISAVLSVGHRCSGD